MHKKGKTMIALCVGLLCLASCTQAQGNLALWPKDANNILEAGRTVAPTVVIGQRPQGFAWQAVWWDSQAILLLASTEGPAITEFRVTYENGTTIYANQILILEENQLFLQLTDASFTPPSEANNGELHIVCSASTTPAASPIVWTEAIQLPPEKWYPTLELDYKGLRHLHVDAATIMGIRMTPSRCRMVWEKKQDAAIEFSLLDADGNRYDQTGETLGTYSVTFLESPYFAKQPLTLSIQLEGVDEIHISLPTF